MTNRTLLERMSKKKTSRIPCWFMRQAGRYLPEYQEVRSKHGMLDVIRTPELAAKVTVQPLKRFDLDAAIIFADILNPLIGMGIELDYIKGEGPKIFNPILKPEDVQKLVVPPVEENIGYTLEAISKVKGEISVPLIGFSGAPFTLSSYMLEEGSPATGKSVKEFALNHPDAWKSLQEKLCDMIAQYAIAQVKAGADVIQLFDSWVGCLSPAEFDALVKPYLKVILSGIKSVSNVPVLYFGTGHCGLFSAIRDIGFDALGVDWRVQMSDVASVVGDQVPLQGNLDPALLFAPLDILENEVNRILEDATAIPWHIFNLGHGILPKTPIAAVEKVIATVRAYEKN